MSRRARFESATSTRSCIPGGYAPDKIGCAMPWWTWCATAWPPGKPVAAICHGPSVLINANVLQGTDADVLAVALPWT